MNKRTQMVIGSNNVALLGQQNVLLIGLGGVGSFVLEALVRSGIGRLTVVDFDQIDISNLNRQILGLTSTIGHFKADEAVKRCLDINPHLEIKMLNKMITSDNIDGLSFEQYDFVVDAIDMVSTKIAIIKRCHQLKVPYISALGTGNKLDPSQLKVTTIDKTYNCPLAKVLRYELRKHQITKAPVIFSPEILPIVKERTPGSMIFVPACAGIMIAQYVVLTLLKTKGNDHEN